MTFNHQEIGSNPINPNFCYNNKKLYNNGYHLMVGSLSSKQKMSVRFRLAVIRISNLIGKGLPCHGSRHRFDPGLIRDNRKYFHW
jgi:hypothetical protein